MPVPGKGWKECAISAFLRWLPEDDRKKLQEWIDAPTSVVRHSDLWRSTTAAYPGQAPPRQTWGRHRRGECSCATGANPDGPTD